MDHFSSAPLVVRKRTGFPVREWSRPASRAGWIPPGGAPEVAVARSRRRTAAAGVAVRDQDDLLPVARQQSVRVRKASTSGCAFVAADYDAGPIGARDPRPERWSGKRRSAQVAVDRRGRGEAVGAPATGWCGGCLPGALGGGERSDVAASEERATAEPQKEGGAHGRSRLLLSNGKRTSRPAGFVTTRATLRGLGHVRCRPTVASGV